MVERQTLLAMALTPLILLGWVTAGRAEDECKTTVDAFNVAIDAGHDAEAQDLVDKIATDALCGRYQVQVQRRLSALRLNAAQDLMARARPSEEYERILRAAVRPGVLWQAAATLAEVRFGERRFAEAALGYDSAIELIKNQAVTPTTPSKFEIQELIDRSTQSRLLEANVGSAHQPPTYVPAMSDGRSGTIGGFYSPSIRGIVPHALPLAIIFDSDKATLTPAGEDAVRELVRAINEQQPGKITIIGHTDVRGGPEYNLGLSRDRAKAVADFIQKSGVTIQIDTDGVGANEPFKVEDSAGLTQDDIYALNRRVEWVRN